MKYFVPVVIVSVVVNVPVISVLAGSSVIHSFQKNVSAGSARVQKDRSVITVCYRQSSSQYHVLF